VSPSRGARSPRAPACGRVDDEPELQTEAFSMNGDRFPTVSISLATRSVLCLMLAPILLAACGGGGGGDAGRGGTVVIAEGADLDKPNPIVSESALDNQVNAIIFMPILATRWENGQLLYQTADEHPMALARSYEFFGPDSASLRYRLRSDVRWTDGRPVTAHDAAWTIETQGREEVASPRVDYNRFIREMVVEDDSTLVIHFERQYPEIFFHTAGAVAPRHVFEGSDVAQLRSHPAVANPVANLVSNGPFRLAGWTRGQQVVLERNPDFEPLANLDRIVFRIIPEETTRIIELQTGNVDMAAVPFNYLRDVQQGGRVRIETQEKRAYEYISYNPRTVPFFADPEIRRALGLGIDKQGLIAALQMDEYATPAGGPYSPIFSQLYDPEGQAPLPFDTVEARRILTEKGFRPGPDGILVRDGRPFRFSLLTNAENRRRVDITQIVERQWRRLGIDVRIQTLEFNTVIQRITNREYEARVGGWNVGLSPDLNQLWGDPELPFNYTSYDNPEVRRLFQLAATQRTEEAAAPYWRQAASLIAADQPYTFLYYFDSPYGVSNRLRGTRVDTLSPYQNTWEWYLE
jgi:peptide/nickel transport system substrate-binding protein